MNRRDFFTLTRRPSASSPKPFAGLRQINAGLTPYAGAWTTKEIAHLLKRTMFGAKKADIDAFRGMSPSQAVDALLNVSATMPDPPLKYYTGDGANDGVATGATWVNTISDDGAVNGERTTSWKNWWIGLMLNQDRTVREKMTLFWHNHFATEASMYENGRFAYIHNNLLRTNSLGNFKTLVRAVTIDPAMLKYLNGVLNGKVAPDENYARELQELFALGKENNPNYTEEDVQEAARVLTGWRIKPDDETVFFKPEDHDTASKTFSSFYNGTVVAGASGATAGDAELDALLNMIFAKTEQVSEFIVKKLYTWFCYYTITPDALNTVIKPLAQQLVAGNWEIKPVLATLLKSDHFFDPLTQGCLIKSPLELAIGMFREFEVAFPADGENQYNMWDYIRNQVSLMQQNPGDPPSVSGWPAYHQVPMFYEMWVNHDTMPKRERFHDQIIGNGYTRNNVTLKIDPLAFTRLLPNAADPNLLINDALDILYRVPLTDTSKATIKKQILLTGQDQDYYWSNAWNAYLSAPTDPAALQTVTTRLQTLYKYFMNLAEYQLA
jgi:uncharacterized protein (DUF1800 family)